VAELQWLTLYFIYTSNHTPKKKKKKATQYISGYINTILK